MKANEVVNRILETKTPTRDAQASLPKSERSLEFGFQTFGDKMLETALEAVKWFCLDMRTEAKPYWLSLVGYSGTGKTYLAQKVCRYFELYVRGREHWPNPGHRELMDYRFRRWSAMMSMIYNGQFDGLRDLCNHWLLVIDDIGAAHDPKGIGASKLLDILEARRGKWTFLTSNLVMQDIAEKIDHRIASRLIRNGSKVIELTCQDFNLREPTNNENDDRTDTQGGEEPLH